MFKNNRLKHMWEEIENLRERSTRICDITREMREKFSRFFSLHRRIRGKTTEEKIFSKKIQTFNNLKITAKSFFCLFKTGNFSIFCLIFPKFSSPAVELKFDFLQHWTWGFYLPTSSAHFFLSHFCAALMFDFPLENGEKLFNFRKEKIEKLKNYLKSTKKHKISRYRWNFRLLAA